MELQTRFLFGIRTILGYTPPCEAKKEPSEGPLNAHTAQSKVGKGSFARLIGGLIVLVFIYVSGIGMAYAKDGAISKGDIEALNEARDIYHANCAMCHGYDGVPILPGAPNFASGERLDKPDPELLASIRDGRETMPPWGDVLSDGELLSVLAYTRLISGDELFLEHCERCHGSSVPPLVDAIPKGQKKLSNYGGPWRLCSGDEIEEMMQREDIITVIQFLRSVPGAELKGMPTEAGG
ncbi:MAG: cytochrome c [Arenicellales bacterium]|nr:cytochrome c [Arenicellales bacterium]MDP6767979.1 cytochrome c [Arenicellales bacterium]